MTYRCHKLNLDLEFLETCQRLRALEIPGVDTMCSGCPGALAFSKRPMTVKGIGKMKLRARERVRKVCG